MKLTPEELARGLLDPQTLSLAVQQVRTNGYVVFEGVLPPELIGELRTAFFARLDAYIASTDPNRGANRYQMHLPLQEPFIDSRVIANPFVLSVMEALLGEDCVCHYFASDTALPGSEHQAVHSDIRLLFPDSDLRVPAYCVVLNIPLVEFREDNGPVEIWPGGTHHFTGSVNLETLAGHMHSEPVLMPAGSLLIRDARMWHRGTPNRSDSRRPNLAMIFARPWLKTDYPPIEIPRATYDGLSERAQRLFRQESIT